MSLLPSYIIICLETKWYAKPWNDTNSRFSEDIRKAGTWGSEEQCVQWISNVLPKGYHYTVIPSYIVFP